MKLHSYLAAYSCILLLSACNFEGKETPAQGITKAAANTDNSPKRKIKNNIQLDAKEINVAQAFLVYADGKLVPETNITGVDEPVKVKLVFDGGFTEKDGKVSLGASERIETSDGELVLDEQDLFRDMEPVTAEAASIISLTANISQLDKLYDYFLVSFRVWDKNGTGEVRGHYKLYIQ